MLLPLYVALCIALIFYVLLPVIGAYLSRDRWRRFRERLIELSLAPRLALGSWLAETGRDGQRLPGRYRMYGAIEAIEGEDRFWVRSPELTAIVDLGHAWFHILAEEGYSEGGYALVEEIPWSKVRVFPEGAKVFVGGVVRIEDGKPLFVGAEDEPLLVVSYDGPEESLLSRLVAGGRRGNEYWNGISRVSIPLGIGIMGLFLAVASAAEFFPTVIFLSILVALAPALALFPPGLPFFFLYMRFWKRGLAARTMRDLLRLPLRFFTQGDSPGADGSIAVPLPEGGLYRRIRFEGELEEGFATLVPWPRKTVEFWVIFSPEASKDPAARRLAVAGDPEASALHSDREALISTLAAGFSLATGIILNIITAFLLWRLL